MIANYNDPCCYTEPGLTFIVLCQVVVYPSWVHSRQMKCPIFIAVHKKQWFCLEVGDLNITIWNKMFRKGSNASLINNSPVQSVDVEWHSLSREMQFVPPSPAKEGVTRICYSIWPDGSRAHPLQLHSLSYPKHRIHDSIKA